MSIVIIFCLSLPQRESYSEETNLSEQQFENRSRCPNSDSRFSRPRCLRLLMRQHSHPLHSLRKIGQSLELELSQPPSHSRKLVFQNAFNINKLSFFFHQLFLNTQHMFKLPFDNATRLAVRCVDSVRRCMCCVIQSSSEPKRTSITHRH